MKEFFKKKWVFITLNFGITTIVLSGLLYYAFFLAPKYAAQSFTSSVESKYSQCKEDTLKLANFVSNWEEISKGDLDKKSEELKKINSDFNSLKQIVAKINPTDEVKETYNTLKEYSEKGIEVSENLEVIALYFKKVEESVKAFNKLNTSTQSLEEVQALVANFKSISESSLVELEKIEAPKLLLGLDKDFKDLLRQYIKSAGDLTDAINAKDNKRLDSAGKESDSAVNAIIQQLNADMKTFKEKSDLQEGILILERYQKGIDEGTGKLKAKYRV